MSTLWNNNNMPESLSKISLACFCKCWSLVAIWCHLRRLEGTLPSCFALQLVRKGIPGMIGLGQCQAYWCRATAARPNKKEADTLGISSCSASTRISRNNLGSDRFSILETPCLHFLFLVAEFIFTLPKLYFSWTKVLCSIANDAKLCGGVDVPKGWSAIQRDLDSLEWWAQSRMQGLGVRVDRKFDVSQ